MSKEYTATLNVREERRAEHLTPVIKGRLHAVIIQSEKQISIKMFLEQFPNITIFKSRSFTGTKYMILKKEVLDEKGDRWFQQSDYWYLNDRIKIVIQGPLFTDVKITLRYE